MKKVRLLCFILILSLLVGGCTTPEAMQTDVTETNAAESNVTEPKLRLIFTLDVEDKYGNVPNMMECEFPVEGNCGVDYIMDTFEKYNMRGVFFVNVYEHLRYSGEYENYMEDLIKNISERGHEVALHSHSEKTLGFYNDELIDMSYEKQDEIIRYGVDFIEKNTGKKPISFRGGGYKVNDETFEILEKNGFKYDSSYYYDNSSNTFAKYNSLNAICKANDEVDELVEFPVIRTIRSDGLLSKLDVNNMPLADMIDVIEQMKEREDFTAAQLMFHSFSFMDQKERAFETPYFHEGTHMGYGVHEGLIERFEDLLEYVSNDPEIEVVTFEEYDILNLEVPENATGDGIFFCDTDKSRAAAKEFVFEPVNKNYREPRIDHYLNALPYAFYFVPQDVVIESNGKMVTFTNNYETDVAEYAWYVYNCDTKETIDKIMYKKDNVLNYEFKDDGHYQVKSFVLIGGKDKDSKIVADIYVNNGELTISAANPS